MDETMFFTVGIRNQQTGRLHYHADSIQLSDTPNDNAGLPMQMLEKFRDAYCVIPQATKEEAERQAMRMNMSWQSFRPDIAADLSRIAQKHGFQIYDRPGELTIRAALNGVHLEVPVEDAGSHDAKHTLEGVKMALQQVRPLMEQKARSFLNDVEAYEQNYPQLVKTLQHLGNIARDMDEYAELDGENDKEMSNQLKRSTEKDLSDLLGRPVSINSSLDDVHHDLERAMEHLADGNTDKAVEAILTVCESKGFVEPTPVAVSDNKKPEGPDPKVALENNPLLSEAIKHYKNNDDQWFNERSDEELTTLWEQCLPMPNNPFPASYDDEVYDAIADRENGKEIFDNATKNVLAQQANQKPQKDFNVKR